MHTHTGWSSEYETESVRKTAKDLQNEIGRYGHLYVKMVLKLSPCCIQNKPPTINLTIPKEFRNNQVLL